MSHDAFMTVGVFLVVYASIAFELLNRTVAALLGVMFLLIFGVIDEHTAAGYIDFETIMLLIGMMGMVAVLKKTGFFNLLTVRIAKLTGGQPPLILILFCTVTAVTSAFLDNVTTVLIMVPIIIELTRGMGIDPKIYVIALAISSNLGGTATLVGDPPNIIIGSKVGLNFNHFLAYLLLPVSLSSVGFITYFRVSNRENFKSIENSLTKLFSVRLLIEKIELDFIAVRIDRRFLYKSMGCLALALLLFVTQTITGIKPGIAALSVAMVLFIMTRVEIEQILREIEWSTLLFFAGLFILVGAMEEKGVIEWIARNIFLRVGTNPYVMTLMVLWVSGIASGFIDNIPFTITMIPIVRMLLETHPIPHSILWWALALGACLGGNLTLIGASANIVSVDLLKKSGVEISFREYMAKSAVAALLSLVISSLVLTGYLWVLA